jgi:hypothetical protein
MEMIDVRPSGLFGYHQIRVGCVYRYVSLRGFPVYEGKFV